MIGHIYRYPEPNNHNQFTLKSVSGFVYEFECGHKVMDTVFVDFIDITPTLNFTLLDILTWQ